ncbi:nitrate transporter [Patellaria atrata CBS 101060]|uniref:Nitrate/nitrite transporter n=1 Tax=Patellaria atrata CBS 101060 TaxID=1346257 RepID=A0A9P4S647_9PEZI|nr:nitrate transporter [Patellaria atrata CBS 101060]
MFPIRLLWASPDVNPINGKARSIPALNPVNMYGRVFFFSWFGFMIAFWSWYAFPPLLKEVIAKDIHLPQHQLANSNIVALLATLLVRLVAGPMCDRFGPRYTFAGCLLAGSIPTFCAGGITNTGGLIAVRFFVGILGGSFVPCQVWSTGFFDKNVVGTANALTGGFGNAGGGITYFVMPAIFESLVSNGLAPHVAWRVSFIVPGILIVSTAAFMLLLCPDCPTGKWSERMAAAELNLRRASIDRGTVVDVKGDITDKPAHHDSPSPSLGDDKKADPLRYSDREAQLEPDTLIESARGEVIQKPTLQEILKVSFSPQVIALGAGYICSFGGELAINSILGNYYIKNFHLSLQEAGNWAAMFGLLNVAFRPLGGVVSDLAYRYTDGSLWAKKLLMHAYNIIAGGFAIAIGLIDPKTPSTMYGLIAGFAFFLEGANGLNFGLVPHVHPYANGIVSGFTGACGNFGGIIFAIIFRYHGTDYAKVFWICGIMFIAFQLAVIWIRPIPKGQIGGH